MDHNISTDQLGFSVRPLLDGTEIARIRSFWDDLDIGSPSSPLVTAVHTELDQAMRVDRWLRDQLGSKLEAEIPGLTPFLATFILKAKEGEEMSFHQDWTYIDERTQRTVNVWVPLVDVDATNGALQVVPGSHRWTSGIRANNIDDDPPTDHWAQEFRARAVSVPMRAGEMVVYDPALVHGSPPNQTDRDRPALGAALAPRNADLVHFRRQEGNHLEGTVVPTGSSYLEVCRGADWGDRPIEAWADPVAPSDFADHLTEPRGGRIRRALLRR